jgi:transposase-like protein
MLDPIFAGRQFPPDIILWAVRWYCRYPLAYRHVEEMLKERGVSVDHGIVALIKQRADLPYLYLVC